VKLLERGQLAQRRGKRGDALAAEGIVPKEQ